MPSGPRPKNCPVCGAKYPPHRLGECIGCGYKEPKYGGLIMLGGFLLLTLITALIDKFYGK
jgi:hypothetical protein